MDDGECTDLLHHTRKNPDSARQAGPEGIFQGPDGPAGALRETTQPRKHEPAAQPAR